MRTIVIVCGLFIMIFTGCQDSNAIEEDITEERAKEMIVERHATRHGDVEILSVNCTEDKYIVRWEIDPIKEGTDSINKQNGDIKVVETSHGYGSCSWRK